MAANGREEDANGVLFACSGRQSCGWRRAVQCGSSGPCLSSDVDAVQGPGQCWSGWCEREGKEWSVAAQRNRVNVLGGCEGEVGGHIQLSGEEVG